MGTNGGRIRRAPPITYVLPKPPDYVEKGRGGFPRRSTPTLQPERTQHQIGREGAAQTANAKAPFLRFVRMQAIILFSPSQTLGTADGTPTYALEYSQTHPPTISLYRPHLPFLSTGRKDTRVKPPTIVLPSRKKEDTPLFQL
ncbi:hypothetical protein SUGI_1032660 [Cryptomeria japonica]|nr:hypothetical protein SUGI_1032660 [Cryptomeria japonica]